MADAIQLITQLKDSGNTKFQNEEYTNAIHDYSIALQLAESTFKQNNQVLIIDLMSLLYSNRSFCKIKLSEYQKAITDCNQSIVLTTHNKNTNYTKLWKTYYRRAICYESLNQFKNALSDLQNANNLWSKYNIKTVSKSNKKNRNKQKKNSNTNNAINNAITRITQKSNKQNFDNKLESDNFLRNNAFIKKHAISLINNGYVIIDNFFKINIANDLLFEFESIMKLQNPSYLKPNTTYFKNKHNQIMAFNKPYIWEVDLHSIFDEKLNKKHKQNNVVINDMKHKQIFKRFYHLFSTNMLSDILQPTLNEVGNNKWNLCKGNGKYGIKLQWNQGKNGCFPYHIDNPGTNKRRITIVFYMNKQWKRGDGGEIVLLPFINKPIIIAPKFNRCAIFLSETMLHRVLPSNKNRYCFSIWIDKAEDCMNIDDLLFQNNIVEEKKSDDDSVRLGNLLINKENEWLNKPSVQCSLSRWVYENEYVESLKACVMDVQSDIYKQLYDMHVKHVNTLKKANETTGLAEIVEWLKNNKPNKDESIYWDEL